MACEGQHWRLAFSEPGLARGSMYQIGIPAPTVAPFQDYQQTAIRSDASLLLTGRRVMTFVWEVLTYAQGFVVRKMVDEALAGDGLLYATISRADGSGGGSDWIDIVGVPHRPLVTGAAPIVGRNGFGHYSEYTLPLHNIVILNDPSIYTDAL